MTIGRSALLVATAAALALGLRSLLGSPVPLAVAVCAFVGYAALVLAGVLIPRLEMFADVLWRGPPGCRGVALTFDDGPDPEATMAVLDTLDAFGAEATFFVLMEKAERYPEVVHAIIARGHLLSLHGHRHDRLLALRSLSAVRAELQGAASSFTALTGRRPRYYRPPVGQINPRIARVAQELGLTLVGWSVRGRDGVRAAPDKVVARVTAGLRDGAIVLLHDAAERDDREPAALVALPRILQQMSERRLDAVRLDAWSEGGAADQRTITGSTRKSSPPLNM